jgi:hypothetical protein
MEVSDQLLQGKELLVAIGWENELVQEPVLDALEMRK